MENSKIVWTHHTDNDWEGCEKVDAGCKHCYAEDFHERRFHKGIWGPPASTPRRRTSEANRRKAYVWNADAFARGVRERVFSLSQGDVFERHPSLDEWRKTLFVKVEQCSQLDYLLLTKRPENVMEFVPDRWHWSWPQNVWLGASMSNQNIFDERIGQLYGVRGPKVIFASFEPLLGPIDPRAALHLKPCSQSPGERAAGWSHLPCDCRPFVAEHYAAGRMGMLHWGIIGGESTVGAKLARRNDFVWMRDLNSALADAGIARFNKQAGDHVVDSACDPDRLVQIRSRKGGDLGDLPEDLRVREFPSPGYTYTLCDACDHSVLAELAVGGSLALRAAPHLAPCGRPCPGGRDPGARGVKVCIGFKCKQCRLRKQQEEIRP